MEIAYKIRIIKIILHIKTGCILDFSLGNILHFCY